VTKDKDFKDVVRERASKTGESYAAARRQLEGRPRSTVWRKSLSTQYVAVIADFEDTLKKCPDDRWGGSVWVVKRDDPFAWPINRGVGEGLPDDERLQLQSAFWNIAYHAIFHVDYYLSGGWSGDSHAPPEPFRGDDHHGNVLPWRAYTRDELLTYLAFCRNKAKSTLKDLSDEGAEKKVHQGQPFAELLIGNLLHAREHQAQLAMFLSDV
jgi:hypothetical protein